VGADRETGCGGNDQHGGHKYAREYGSVSGEDESLDGISCINTAILNPRHASYLLAYEDGRDSVFQNVGT
jgi:hypothetical protein